VKEGYQAVGGFGAISKTEFGELQQSQYVGVANSRMVEASRRRTTSNSIVVNSR
jgi:hypothetical protein